MPNKWWERIRLPSNYSKALELVDERLAFWPKFLVHKCKQRLTRLTQVAIRTKRLAKEQERLGERLVPKLAPKVRRREETRERKAEAAAKVEKAIERELMERLRSGAYGDKPINVEENIWKKVLKGLERAGEGERELDPDDGIEDEEYEEELEYEQAGEVEYVSDVESESDEDLDDLEDWIGSGSENGSEEIGQSDGDETGRSSEEGTESETDQLTKATQNLKRKRPIGKATKPSKKTPKGPKREIEYEIEKEPSQREILHAF